MSKYKESKKENQVMTNFEYISSLSPSKLAQYFRMKFAHNQGCPPVPLMQVFTMCKDRASCDECWWGWLCAEHDDLVYANEEKPQMNRCWDCRWGVRQDTSHACVVCMHKKFYGVVMDPEDFCSFRAPRYKTEEEKKSEKEIALRIAEMKAEKQDDVAAEIRKRYELKLLARERERRRIEKGIAAELDSEEAKED